MRTVCQAGARPNKKQLTNAAKKLNSTTRQSNWTPRGFGGSVGTSSVCSSKTPPYAKSNPAAPPSIARRKLSVIN
jgi:hypothetical protein